jgi:hypothetical protein
MLEEQVKNIFFQKTEIRIVEDPETFDFKEQCYTVTKSRKCKIIPLLKLNSNITATAYMFQEDPPYIDPYEEIPEEHNSDPSKFNKINVYSTTESGLSGDTRINEDFWYIKLTIKEDKRTHMPYIYVNFIRSVIGGVDRGKGYTDVKLPTIIDMIKNVTAKLGYRRIVLQDDAEFSCNNENKYTLKAMCLRAIDRDPKRGLDKISIYSNYGFTPTKFKSEDIRPCIESLRSVTCGKLLDVSKKIKKILTRIDEKEINYYIYRMLIAVNPSQPDDLIDVNYSDIKQIGYSSICQNYISNLDKLILYLNKGGESSDKSIYSFYQELCEQNPEDPQKFMEEVKCCNLRKEFLACLRNSINSYVIITRGSSGKIQEFDHCIQEDSLANSSVNSESDINSEVEINSYERKVSSNIFNNTCSVNIPDGYPHIEDANKPIIITKLFNLFNGTFEKLKYIYNEMEYIVQP